ncbi:MAG: leucine-rich repeat protein, partial [Eubacterium sp.]
KMKKVKALSLTLAVLLLICSLFSSVPAFAAEDGADGFFLYSVSEDNTAQITGYTGDEVNIEIPQTVGQYEVTSIGDSAFKGLTSLKSVTIPDTVKAIGDYAFDCCTNLETITLPDSVESIGKAAFFSCTRLKSANLSENLKTIGDGAFYDCKTLEGITLPDGVTTVGEYAFGKCLSLKYADLGSSLDAVSNQLFINCESLAEVTIPDTAASIGRKAFSHCLNLTSVEIPQSVKSIGSNAFSYCGALESLYVPAEEIGTGAFSCSGIKSLTFTENLKRIEIKAFFSSPVENIDIPASVNDIEYGAFAQSNLVSISVDADNKYYTSQGGAVFNADMTEIIAYPAHKDDETAYSIPDGIVSIAPYAFSNCYALQSISLPQSIETIGDYAFENMNMTDITIPDSVTSIGKYSFSFCYSLENITIPDSVSQINEYTFFNCSELKDVTLSEGITKIDTMAFAHCYSLSEIILPASLESVSSGVFYETGIEGFEVSEDSKNFTCIDGVLFSKDLKELAMYPPAKADDSYIIPDATLKIGAYAFSDNFSLLRVTVPDSVTEIGEHALGFGIPCDSDSYDRTNDFMIFGGNNSAAYEYAVKNDIAFFTGTPFLNSEVVTLDAGETFDFKIENSVPDSLAFTSSDDSIATIDSNGTITAISSGETEVLASIGTMNFICTVIVSGDGNGSNENKAYDTSAFRKLTIDDYAEWEDSYYEYNSGISFDAYDNTSISCYTGNEYLPILGIQSGGAMLEQTKKEYGKDYAQYEVIADNLSIELGRFSLNTDLVLYSGTDDVSFITGKTSSVKDMKESIGTRFTSDSVISTSISQAVGVPFAPGTYGTMLEIYAPASL